jgi:phosphopantothenoylcysteine decarboxylase/phosphopantothenate--cysteine ligase
VITAGPTQEAVDPVRFLSNRSSGKMGFALAQAARDAGAEVTLISGPVRLDAPRGVQRIDTRTAQQMYDAALKHAPGCDIFIAAAAVADYRPKAAAKQKIKKSQGTLTLELVRNPDIVSAVTALKGKPFEVGFAAETQNLLANARAKLRAKRLDLVIANDVGGARGGFDSDDNAVTVVWSGGTKELPLASKQQIARQLVELIAARLPRRKSK